MINDWRIALLESVNLSPQKEEIKLSLQSNLTRFSLNRKTGKVTPINDVVARFNWPLDLTKKSSDVPIEAQKLHIKHLPEALPFWKLKEQSKIIIPVTVWGKFGFSVGFLAINLPDKTIAGVRFYHSEDTPGLGQEVLNADFGQRFVGKHLFGKEQQFQLKLTNSKIADSNQFEVDGITGATITSSGIQKAVEFWTGHNAYAPILK
ncbi:FMN-binding protein [Phocoenobacter atlanticus subsp. cyclopteri]|uniref:FMN-binding protein n=1 Tax=Phocoenobacter atlanticus TaxID=3416742 RepID=UPI001BC8E614|nr:FMN-binding protein [Pasteurella atlantica]QVE21488.1 FMN-binding protein [Pasteurella atlantica]